MSDLCLHAGASIVTREQLALVEAPSPTETWFPVRHDRVISTVEEALQSAGFGIVKASYGLTRHAGRMFATLDLSSAVSSGVHLCVGVRNSIDRSLPLGFCAGSRVFVCDNLAFRSELLVARKHTRNGADRFREAILHAVASLAQFQEVERRRIRRFQQTDITDTEADSLMLRAYEKNLVSHRTLPRVIKAWRAPTFEEFSERNLWSLFNAFTTALTERSRTNPQQFAALTMRLQEHFGSEPEEPEATRCELG